MTQELPDDMFIENSDLPAQLAAGNAIPQPGIYVEGDGEPVAKPRNTGLTLFVVLLVSLVVAGGGLALVALFPFGGPLFAHEPAAPSAGEVAPVGTQASAADMYDKYIAKTEDDSIYLIIPRTDEGWDYFRAFMYKITDYKIAESIGGPLEAEQIEEMLALEQRFLALEDLELTVDITRTDGTRFVHDGKPPAAD